jgi:hypothetical protein
LLPEPWRFPRSGAAVGSEPVSSNVKLYHYVGPDHIRAWAVGAPPGFKVESPHELAEWLRSQQQRNPRSLVAVTFVVDAERVLRLADRGSEHVACAGGGPVLSAGEMFFHAEDGWRVEEASNQSTGYCPEPESWTAVAAVLDGLSVPHPGRFTAAVVFRRCPACGERNIVKDGWFLCGVCGADLPADWNF